MRCAVAAVLFLAACSSDSGPKEIRSSRSHEEHPAIAGVDSLVAANTELAVKLYKVAAKEDGNIIFSPHSISTVFAMLYAGTNGNTAAQLEDVFGFTPDTHVAENALELELASRAENSGGFPFALRTANSMWGQDGTPFEAPFLDTLAINYNAGVHVVNYIGDHEGARQQINDWVDDKTEHHITDLLPPNSLDDQVRIVLTNAIYMKAAWKTKFEKAQTSDQPFHAPSGDVTVPMMRGESVGRFFGAESYVAGELSYAGVPVAMTIVVPDDLAQFEAALDHSVLENIQSSMSQTDLTVSMPRFTLSQNLKLKDALIELGVTDAFMDGVADLLGIETAEHLWVFDALHKGYISVDEDGTTAAAASAVIGGDDSAGSEIRADKPFLFFIHDTETHEILFIGRVVNPTAN